MVGAGTDRLLEERARQSKDGKAPGATQSLRNLALYGGEQVNVMASAIAESESLRVAGQLSKCNEKNWEQQLQLIEQVLIRTDPSSPERHGPTSFHLDWIFLREHYDAVPRQTYFHMVTYLCDVAPGQAALFSYDAVNATWTTDGSKDAHVDPNQLTNSSAVTGLFNASLYLLDSRLKGLDAAGFSPLFLVLSRSR